MAIRNTIKCTTPARCDWYITGKNSTVDLGLLTRSNIKSY